MSEKRSFQATVDQIYNSLPSMADLAGVQDHINTSHPIHGSDKGQNFRVDGEVWFCFRHHTGGTKFDWIAVQEGILPCEHFVKGVHVKGSDFFAVLEIAARRTGVDLDLSPEERKDFRKNAEEVDLLCEMHEFAEEYYKERLKKEKGVIDWIKKKYGFSEDTIEKFDIGYAPTSRELRDLLIKKFGEEEALKSGLLLKVGNFIMPLFQGRVVFPYTLRGKTKYFIARRVEGKTPEKSHELAKYKKLLTFSGKHDYVSKYVIEPIFGGDIIPRSKEILITEGITDAISARAHGFNCISPVTVRFKEKHGIELSRKLKGKKVYVCMDNEESGAGLEGAMAVLGKLHNDAYLIELPRAADQKKVDLNDYFKSHSRGDFEKLMENAAWKWDALCQYRGNLSDFFTAALIEGDFNPLIVRATWNKKEQLFENIKSITDILEGVETMKKAVAVFRRVSGGRAPNRIDKGERKRVLAGAVKRHILTLGDFILDDTLGLFFFSKEKKEVYSISKLDPERWNNFLYEKYGLNTALGIDNFIVNDVKEFGMLKAKNVSIKKLFYYDKEENKLYIFNRGKYYFELDGKTVKKKLNGTNGIYFRNQNVKGNVQYIPPEKRDLSKIKVGGQIPQFEGRGDIFDHVLINRTNFEYETALDVEQQRNQLKLLYYTVPFYSLLGSKPIAAFVGQKGSGKTTTARMFGEFLVSPDFREAGVPEKEGDFVARLINNFFIVLDNADSFVPWLADILSSIATGAGISIRELFKTAVEFKRRPEVFMTITSRTPKWKRDDVVDRCLIFHVKRIKEEISEFELYRPFKDEECLNILCSTFMDNLNKILAILGPNLDKIMSAKHFGRLVGWANLAKAVADALGIEGREKLLIDMNNEKATFSLQNDPLRDAIEEWRGSLDFTEKELTSTELKEILSSCRESGAAFAERYKTVQKLGKRLSIVESELSDLYGFRRRKDLYKHHYVYSFAKPSHPDIPDIPKENSLDISETETKIIESKDQKAEMLQLLDIISDLDKGDGTSFEEIMEEASKRGMSEKFVKIAMGEFKMTGDLYEPNPNKFKVLRAG